MSQNPKFLARLMRSFAVIDRAESTNPDNRRDVSDLKAFSKALATGVIVATVGAFSVVTPAEAHDHHHDGVRVNVNIGVGAVPPVMVPPPPVYQPPMQVMPLSPYAGQQGHYPQQGPVQQNYGNYGSYGYDPTSAAIIQNAERMSYSARLGTLIEWRGNDGSYGAFTAMREGVDPFGRPCRLIHGEFHDRAGAVQYRDDTVCRHVDGRWRLSDASAEGMHVSSYVQAPGAVPPPIPVEVTPSPAASWQPPGLGG